MARFLLRRILQSFLVVWAIITVTFFMVHLAPGDPFQSEKAGSEIVRQRLMEYHWLDKPIGVRYLRYLSNLAHGDLGPSMKYEGRTVAEIVTGSFPISLRLGLCSLVVALALGIPAGIIAGVRKNTVLDYGPMSLAMVGICIPTFVLGPLLALVFGLKWGWFNVAGLEVPSDYILPALTIGLGYAAYVARLTRSGMLEVMNQDFIRTARAKGASESRVIFRHALRVGLQPVISFFGPALVGIISGSFIVEKAFQIPGLGQHFVEAATNRDYQLVVGTAAFYGVLLVLANLLVDIIQAILNPRIRLQP